MPKQTPFEPEKVSNLRPGEAFIWSSKATDDAFTKSAVKIRCRPRVTTTAAPPRWRWGHTCETATWAMTATVGCSCKKADWGRELPERGKNVCARLCALLECLHYLSTTQVDAREPWGLAGVQGESEFVSVYADFGEFANAINGLRNPRSYCFEQ